MKLHEAPRGSYVKILPPSHPVRTPPGGLPGAINGVYLFEKTDGMYSVCWDYLSQLVHLAVWTEVEVVTQEEYLAQQKFPQYPDAPAFTPNPSSP